MRRQTGYSRVIATTYFTGGLHPVAEEAAGDNGFEEAEARLPPFDAAAINVRGWWVDDGEG